MYWKPWKISEPMPKSKAEKANFVCPGCARPEAEDNEFRIAIELGLARAHIKALEGLLLECLATWMFDRGTTISDLERRIKSALEP